MGKGGEKEGKREGRGRKGKGKGGDGKGRGGDETPPLHAPNPYFWIRPWQRGKHN